jgi:hypothetical protein
MNSDAKIASRISFQTLSMPKTGDGALGAAKALSPLQTKVSKYPIAESKN